MAAECITRPQYVLRSYWEAGNSRLPGREADIVLVLESPYGFGRSGIEVDIRPHYRQFRGLNDFGSESSIVIHSQIHNTLIKLWNWCMESFELSSRGLQIIYFWRANSDFASPVYYWNFISKSKD